MTILLAADASKAPAPIRAASRPGYVPYGLFRLLLALLVLVQHAAANVAPAWLTDSLVPLDVGSTAVYVFFVLSGAIIADAMDLTYARRPGAFLLNRLLRIVPSYAIALIVFAAVAAVAFRAGLPPLDTSRVELTPEHLVSPAVWAGNLAAAFPFMPQSLFGPVPIFIPVIWAVRVEMLFYAVMGLALLIARAGLPLDRVLAAMGVAALALPMLDHGATADTALAHMPFFVLGVALQRLTSRRGSGRTGVAVAGAFAVAALALCVMRLAMLPEVIGTTGHTRAIGGVIGLFLGLTVLLVGLACLRLPQRGRFAGLDRVCGELTYPLYLNHIVVVVAAAAIFTAPTLAETIAVILISVAVSMLVAAPTEPLIARARRLVRGRDVTDG